MTGPAPKYETTLDLGDRNNSHTLLHELACSSGKRDMQVLEVGCASGYLGATLEAAGHRVTGIEPDFPSASLARERITEVFHGSIESFFAMHGGRRFDVVVLGDVLEHLVEPLPVLAQCRDALADGGSLVISLPAVIHGSVRAMLLAGRWDEAELGLLDRTHLHHFSRGGVAKLMSDARLEIRRYLSVIVPIDTAGDIYDMRLEPELVTVVELLDRDGTGTTFQHVLLAVPAPNDVSDEALLAANLAIEPEPAAPPPWLPRPKWKQRLRLRLFHWLLRELTSRRLRRAGR